MLIKREVTTPDNPDLFEFIGVRELARLTGLDAGYLSRVKNNHIAVTEKRHRELWAVVHKFLEGRQGTQQ